MAVVTSAIPAGAFLMLDDRAATGSGAALRGQETLSLEGRDGTVL